MPISRYDIVVATHPKELNALMADGGYVAIGYIYAQPSYGLQAVGEGEIDPWGSVTDYELVQAQFYQDLIPLVNEKIADGYQPIGGLAHWANAFVQAVGKVSGSGMGGVGGDLPTGKQYDVITYDKSNKPVAAVIGMRNWIGTEVPASSTPLELAPTTMNAPEGQKPTQSMRALDALPNGSTIAFRDINGNLGVSDATRDYHATNLKQVEDMITERLKTFQDNIIDFINNGGSK